MVMNSDVKKLFEHVDMQEIGSVTENDLQSLPEVVQKYLRFTGIVGKKMIKTVRLRQRGDFRLKPDQNFKKMEAVQYFNVDLMEFYWKGKVMIVTATDRFIEGKGDLMVKLLGLFKVAYAEGPEVDQGEILRFLAEGVWFPSVFVKDYIMWEEIDDHTAKATITHNNLRATATFFFNEKNQVEKITAKRYMERDGKFELKDWEIIIKEYKEFNDIRIPYRSEVIWKLENGDFCWYKPEVYEIEYNEMKEY
ncbi:MAG: hypothetical protein Kow00108_16890 [Calditrichia bacterium]